MSKTYINGQLRHVGDRSKRMLFGNPKGMKYSYSHVKIGCWRPYHIYYRFSYNGGVDEFYLKEGEMTGDEIRALMK